MGFSAADFNKLTSVHNKYFRKFVYVTDQEQHGLIEHWVGDDELRKAINGARLRGDCEEFARTCMLDVMDSGYRARLVFCIVETGDGHAVCEVVSADGKAAYFMDNRHKRLMTASELQAEGYKFLAASPWSPTPADKRPWVRVA